MMREDGCSIFDFGAESTAPFNQTVSLEEEFRRLEALLFPALKVIDSSDLVSIDTYKVEVMDKMMSSGELDSKKVIFNDVSGALDSKLEEFLLRYHDVTYVYSHNLAPGRDSTQTHMDHLCSYNGDDLIKHIDEYFEEAKEWFKAKGIENTIWFDPCFGFSKTTQQNLDLIAMTPKMISGLGPDQTWLLGISKKSFLRSLVGENLSKDEQFKRAEQAHAAILSSWMRNISSENQVVIRLHDISLFQSVKRCKFLYES